MFPQFKNHINNNLAFLNGKKLLVAFSGGLDSVVLAHLCVGNKMEIALAHCNFNLRGEESDGDEDFVRQLGSKLGISVFVEHFETKQFAEDQRVSVQMAARELRYQWFEELLKIEGFDFVLTAHHADDSLETFIINLSRGTGIEGLSGIPEVNGNLVRPLLEFSREEILAYADANEIKWREDSSNAENKYLRNKIRHEIVPKLKELHPSMLQNFQNTQKHLQQTDALATNHLLEVKHKLFQYEEDQIKIKIGDLLELKPLDAYLYGLLNPYGFTEWNDVKHLLHAMSGKQVFSKTHGLLKNRDVLILSKLNNRVQQEFPVYLDGTPAESPVTLKLEPVRSMQNPEKKTIFLDKEKLNFPLVLRNWEKGDYFYPFGMKGKKKLSKFFKDEKLDLISKEKQWLLCSNDEIVWVVGKRADERFKVEDSTQEIIKITQLT
ncbi:tRNA lysidine(34) synthetase TilS [Flagellimonas zhangzhouensis]|uniref:tRNA(Ile)-lysidine synthase n=1 Tax=Flagellimonas zhangzhouensis TaxID=1073328 RepID=A0A1H2S8Q7_9FLAO|nr:tRNA lysidine(34) synthetase TilS [Allomuricauda zhangzhouensis]SDQ72068.1 tRNA(Ile)-lysidine synthase [Allomuricauda zhangzhouensis]SDW28031.1 tRNA(Ile)-lysidine synthase [Allomuricauda zhangzhouensis]